MTEDVKALLAEARSARGGRFYGPISDDPGVVDLIGRLADALEAAQVPATDDERGEYTTGEYVAAIRSAVVDIADMHPGRGCIGCHWCTHVTMLDGAADALEGFRRSSRVPVSRDELANAWDEGAKAERDYQWRNEDSLAAGQGVVICRKKNPYIFPKADRKPADSGEAGR